MLVRFNKRTIVGGTTYSPDDGDVELANDMADQVVAEGNGVVVGLGRYSDEARFAKDSGGHVTGLLGLAASLPPLRAMVFGNSIANQSKRATGTGTYYFTLSAVRAFNAMMQHTFEFDDTGDSTIGGQDLAQGVWGYSGATSSTMVPYLDECLAAYNPGVVFLHLFENDITSALTLADSYANLKTAVNACKNAGAVPIVFTCLPSLSYTTTAHRDYWAQLNDLIFEYCASVAGVIPVDLSAYLDTTATYPQPLSTYTDASVHPTNKGQIILASWIYDQIGGLFQKRKHRASKTDGNAVLSVIPNPSMGGTGGSNGTNSSGSVADSWTAAAYGTGHAVVASKVADGLKNSQKLSASYSGAGWASGDSLALYGANVTTGFSAGEKIYFEIEIEVTGTPVALKAIYGDLLIGGSAEHAYTEGFQGSADAGLSSLVPSGRYKLRSPIYTIPASATGLRPYIFAKYETGITAASVDLTVHSAVIRKVPFAQA